MYFNGVCARHMTACRSWFSPSEWVLENQAQVRRHGGRYITHWAILLILYFPPFLCMFLGLKPRAVYMWDKPSTIVLYPQAPSPGQGLRFTIDEDSLDLELLVLLTFWELQLQVCIQRTTYGGLSLVIFGIWRSNLCHEAWQKCLYLLMYLICSNEHQFNL